MQDSIKLVYYRVNKINFKYNEQNKPDTKFQIKPKFSCKMGKKEKMLIMSVGITVSEEVSSPVPFELDVEMIGTFTMDEYAAEDTKIQMRSCLTQLIPFLRAAVANFTLNCNIPSYLFPMLDVNSMVNSVKDDFGGNNYN